MDRVSDLVKDSKLKTSFHGDVTKHIIEKGGRTGRQRKIREEQQWQQEDCLGEGTFGVVWRERLIAGEFHANERAVKVIKKRTKRSSAIDIYNGELKAIAKFSHSKYNACFVESYGWFESDSAVFIAMEYFPEGDLQEQLSRHSTLPESEVQQIAAQVLEGLEHMHDNGFAHRDLKPSNILVRYPGPDWWVKIGDFGVSKRTENGVTALRTLNGTPGFLAPEVLLQNGMLVVDGLDIAHEYTFAVDIWSLGEILYRALCGQPPFQRSLAAYVSGRSSFPLEILQDNGVTFKGCKLVESLMKALPAERLTASGALDHPWVKVRRDESPKSSEELSRSEDIPRPSKPSVETCAAENIPTSMTTEASGRWSTLDDSDDDIVLTFSPKGSANDRTLSGDPVLSSSNNYEPKRAESRWMFSLPKLLSSPSGLKGNQYN